MGCLGIRGVVVAALVASVSSCSSTNESDASIAPPVETARLNAANGTPATFGVPVVVGDLKVTASDPVVETDESGPWLTVTVRAENRSQIDVQSPQFVLRCAGSSSGGTWLETSTFKQGEPVHAGSSNAGSIGLLMPGDDRLGRPRPSCAAPATVVATLLVFDNAGAGAPVQKRVGWAVPDELVDELNAAPQPNA